MALKTRGACCLLLSFLVFMEMAGQQECCEVNTTTIRPPARACDALIDVTALMDFSSSLDMKDYTSQHIFFGHLTQLLFPSPNDVHVNIRFYHSFVLENLPVFKYGSVENISWLERILQTAGDYQRENEGEDVITALIAASRPMPETECRRKRGGRRIVVVVADEVDETVLELVSPSDFRKIMGERGVEIVALAIGNSSTLDVLDDILDPNYGDTIIRLDSFDKLLVQDVMDEILNELCEVAPEMTSYKERLSTLFRASFTYNGHAYYLSREEADNLIQMHETCSSAGGYLAVMNDQQEYDAMKQYFIDNDPGYGFYIDGTDAHIEGMWTLLSGAPLPFVDWKDGRPIPDKPDKSCLIWTQRHQMIDEFCDGQNHPKFRYLFLCEVPDTCDAKWRFGVAEETRSAIPG